MLRLILRNERWRYSRAWHARGLVIMQGFITFWRSSRKTREIRPIATQRNGKKLVPRATAFAPIKIILIGNTYCLRIIPSSHGRNTGWLRNLYVAYNVFRVALVTLRIRDLPSGFMKNADSWTFVMKTERTEKSLRVLIMQNCIPQRVTLQSWFKSSNLPTRSSNWIELCKKNLITKEWSCF